MSGRPKSARLKVIEGNAGRRDMPRQPAALDSGPKMPADLSPAAQQEWRRVTPLLRRQGTLSARDLALLTEYCECYAEARAARALVHRHGVIVRGARAKVKNPALQVERDCRMMLLRYADALGLSPASRARMAVPDLGTDDDPEGLLD